MIEQHPPILIVPVKPTAAADRARLLAALSQLAAADAAPEVSIDEETGGILLGAMSERDLGGCVGRLTTNYSLRLDIGAPQVAYRETIAASIVIDHTHKKTAGGANQFARVKISFELGEPGREASFSSRLAPGSLSPPEFARGVEAGVMYAFGSGIIAGFPVYGVTAALLDGAFHDTDSSKVAFEITGRAAAREALARGGAVLLEPMMRVEIQCDGESASGIAADLKLRRGEIWKQRPQDGAIAIGATAPLANLLGYVNSLARLSQGRASFEMTFSHYAAMPGGDGGDDPGFRPAAAMRA